MFSTLADRSRGLFRSSVCIAFCGVIAAGALVMSSRITCAADDPPAPFPEPSPFPTTWELKFKHSLPKRIVVQLPNQKFPTAYWYFTYTVINRGEKEADFEPEFDLMTDDRKVYRGNRAIPSEIFEDIKKREGNALLMSPRKVSGIINTGEEQARESVAIWEEPMRKMGSFSVFVAGLSGESMTMKKVGDKYLAVDPAKAAVELKDVKEEDRLILRKQLHLRFTVLGDERNTGQDPVTEKPEKWVMR
jgi:hypothetical protein